MTFIMSNGSPATFAATRAEAEERLGTADIQEIPHRDLSAKDWAAADMMFGYDAELPCYAVAC